MPLALKELVHLKLQQSSQQRLALEERYGMDFVAFQQAWMNREEQQKYSYEVEQDWWEWEAAVTDAERYQGMLKGLP